MIPGADPAVLGPNARLGEIAALLATGYRRLVQGRQNGLALDRLAEPSCTAVDGDERHEARAPATRTEDA